jgi:hypothetical protein
MSACVLTSQGFTLVVKAFGWHASDLGAILSRDSLYAFWCMLLRRYFTI